jgi:hypothetical protein
MQASTIAVIKLADWIAEAEFQRAVCAINRQITQDFMPFWGCGKPAKIYGLAHPPESWCEANADIARADGIVYVVDRRGLERAVDHYRTRADTTPVRLAIADPAAWTAMLSHEVLELLVNPASSIYVRGPDPRVPGNAGTWLWHAYETCDAVERTVYTIAGVAVSNFVTPHYFSLERGPDSMTDFLGTGVPAFSALPGCHVSAVNPKNRELEIIRPAPVTGHQEGGHAFRFHEFERPEDPIAPPHGTAEQIAKIISDFSDKRPATPVMADFGTVTPRDEGREPASVTYLHAS